MLVPKLLPNIAIFCTFFPMPDQKPMAFLSIAGSFGALLAGRLVVVARGLYLARHLFTLSQVPGETIDPQEWSERGHALSAGKQISKIVLKVSRNGIASIRARSGSFIASRLFHVSLTVFKGMARKDAGAGVIGTICQK